MAILKKTNRRRIIDLTGPNGNGYFLIGMARNLGKQLSLDTKEIIEEMTSGDYENLIKVFDKHFGQYVDLER